MELFIKFCLWYVGRRRWHGFKTVYCMTTAMTFLFPDSSNEAHYKQKKVSCVWFSK